MLKPRKAFLSKKNRIILLCVIIAALFSLCSCNRNEADVPPEEDTVVDVLPGYEKEESEEHISDNMAWYRDYDPYKVIDFYLTVSEGNEGDSSNHTWEEINEYSAYYYDDLGVERYKVEGILQIDDGNGLGEGSFGYGEKTPNVTVQIRGQTSSKSATKNYKIRVKSGKGEYNSQRTFALNKHVADPYRFINKLAYDLLIDVPQLLSAQTRFVRLHVKDLTSGSNVYEDYGIYTWVEQVNKTYLKNHGLDERGQSYKVSFFEWTPDAPLLATGDDFNETEFERYIEIKGDEDNTKLQEVLKLIQNYNVPITQIVDDYFDSENLIYWFAFNILIGNYDSGPRNCYLYSPLNSEKWYYIPWDHDAGFRYTYLKYKEHTEGDSWERGATMYLGLNLYNRMMKETKYRTMLDDAVEELYSTVLNPESVQKRMNRYAELIRDDIYENKIDKTSPKVSIEKYDEFVADLSHEITDNYNYYYESKNLPWPYFVDNPHKDDDGHLSITWGRSYDPNGEEIKYSYILARDCFFTDIVASEENLMVPFVELEAPAPGKYYVRVTATNESGLSMYNFDYFRNPHGGKIYGCLEFTIAE